MPLKKLEGFNMLIEKWKQTVLLLLMDYDLNLQITVATNATSERNLSKNLKTEDIWKEYIFKSIGNIPDTDGINTVSLFIAKDGMYNIYKDTFFGNKFIDYFWNELLDADGVRIKITKRSGEKMTRIIVR
jgi:hypothetical protein